MKACGKQRWRWRRCSSETSVAFNGLLGIISEKAVLFITTAVRKSNPTRKCKVWLTRHSVQCVSLTKNRNLGRHQRINCNTDTLMTSGIFTEVTFNQREWWTDHLGTNLLQAVTLRNCIRAIIGSNSARYTDYPDRGFVVLLSHSRHITEVTSYRAMIRSSQIISYYFSLIILPLNFIYYYLFLFIWTMRL
jgi:hypothetical protein